MRINKWVLYALAWIVVGGFVAPTAISSRDSMAVICGFAALAALAYFTATAIWTEIKFRKLMDDLLDEENEK